MDYEKTLEELKHMKVETGSFVCLGCGYEHNCSIHGCAILRDAVACIDELKRVLQESEAARADLGKRLAAAQQELAEVKAAERDGRMVVLPFKPHSTMLDSTDVANPMLMNDVRLAVAWTSSCGVLFYTPLDHFLRDMQEGKICLLKERHCDKCDYWTENDPRCMCSESQWTGRKVKANNYCSRFIRRRGRDE